MQQCVDVQTSMPSISALKDHCIEPTYVTRMACMHFSGLQCVIATYVVNILSHPLPLQRHDEHLP